MDSQPAFTNVRGTSALSGREAEVLSLLAQGLTNQEIGHALGLSVKTAETYRTRMKKKLKLTTRAELFRYALSSGIVAMQKVSEGNACQAKAEVCANGGPTMDGTNNAQKVEELLARSEETIRQIAELQQQLVEVPAKVQTLERRLAIKQDDGFDRASA